MPRAGFAIVGCGVLGYYTWRYPWTLPPAVHLDAPEFGKAVAMLVAVGALVLVDLAALAIAPWPKADGSALFIPQRLGVGLLVLANLVLLLAAFHLLLWPALMALLAVPVLLRALPLARELGGTIARPRGLPLALVTVALVAPTLCAFVPYYGWDGLTYHLAIPERYLFTNGIWVTPFSLFTAFPHVVEMLYALALGLRSPALAKLINVQFGVLTLVVAYVVAARRSRRAGLIALALVVGDPLFEWELNVTYADLALCCYAMLAAATFCDLAEAPRRGTVWQGAIFAGACVAIKYVGVFVPLALGILLLGPTVRARWPVRRNALFAIAAAGGLIFLPWMIRDFLFTGNPVAPAFQPTFNAPGREYFDPITLRQAAAFQHDIGMGHGLRALLLLPWNVTMRTTQGVYGQSFGFQIGPLHFLGAVLALAVPETRRDAGIRFLLALGALLTVGWFLSSQEARLLLPALVMFAVVGAVAIDRIVAERPSPSRLLLALPIYVAAYGLWRGVENCPWYYSYALGHHDGTEIEARDPAYFAAQLLHREMGRGGRVLLLFEGRGYVFRGLDYIPTGLNEASSTLQLVHRAPDTHALACRLAELGVTHVVLNLNYEQKFPPRLLDDYGEAEFRADLLRIDDLFAHFGQPLANHAGVRVLELRRPSDCVGG